MDYYVDDESFQAHYDRAIAGANKAFIDAGREVKGASARTEAAKRDLEDLLDFRDQVSRLIREAGFAGLPRLRSAWRRRIEGYHHLTIGGWRGLFLVARDGSAAVAAIFSKEPHDYYHRLDEVRARHADKLTKPEPPEETPEPTEPLL